ncbi:hypothetical protein ACHQM5_004735 [Ranunculus cassubicifolius]
MGEFTNFLITPFFQHSIIPNMLSQCESTIIQVIDAPIQVVWSLVRRFDKPQAYKVLVRGCKILRGNGDIGSVREVRIMSDLPAEISIERLDVLDDDLRVISFSIIGGDHLLTNYRSTLVLFEDEDEPLKTIVKESYAVDVTDENSEQDIGYFVGNIIGWNLKSLAAVAEKSYTAYCQHNS